MELVEYIDDRPKWMIREDEEMHCFHHCSLFRHCLSINGRKCTHFGGDMIPKIKPVSCQNPRRIQRKTSFFF